jgi:predicted extracellular nuclease
METNESPLDRNKPGRRPSASVEQSITTQRPKALSAVIPKSPKSALRKTERPLISATQSIHPATRGWIITVLLITLCLLVLKSAIVPRPVSAATSVFINEIHYDNTGTDAGEAIEIAGPAGTDLTGWSIVLYNGTGGAVYDTDILSGTIPNQQNGFGTVSLTYPVNGIQNGSPDGIALVNSSSVVVQFLSYEGTFTAVGGPANGMLSTDIGVSETGSEPLGQSLRLTGTGCMYEDFTWSSPAAASFGAVNTGQTFSCGGGVSLSINDTTVTEGNGGTVIASFTVTLSSSTHTGVTFDISTQDDSATTGNNDYVAKTLVSQTIPNGSNTYNFDVTVNGDTTFEPNETFLVNATNVVGATVSDGQGVGTINNDDCPPSLGDIVISQVYGGGGNAGATFTHDFVELFNQGPVAINLSGWSVQYISGTGTGTWAVTPLAGLIAPGGYYLVQEAQGAGGTTPLPTPDAVGTIAMAAGAGKVALSSNTTPFSGNCPNCVVDLVGYGGATCFEGAGPTAATSNTTAALRKRGGCFDSDNNNIDFSIGSPLPRNTASPTKDCGFIALAIHDIQGAGLVTPFLGQDVSTTGIVTGLKTNGFFMQTSDVDANPATSEGIFVFTSSAPTVAAGNAVTAQGTASEFFNLTQIESTLPGDVIVNSTGNPLPAAVTFTTMILDPAGMPTQLERFEGMRMHADSLVSVAPTNEFGETFTVLQGVARPLREPGIEISLPIPPDPTSGVPDCCIPRWDENPERIMIDSDGLAGASVIATTSNVTFSNVTGPLDFTFSAYKVLPETPPTTSANISAVPVPVPVAGEFTVGGFNIENFGNNATQRQKAALAIRTVMRYPDVIGHIEILNLASLQALAAQVNADAVAAGDPDPLYEARLIQAPAGGTQNVGFLVKTSRVQIDAVTQERGTETYINPINNQPEILHDRPPLVLRATVDPSGVDPRPIIVIVNHLRSFIDIELVGGDGPRVRAKRKAQAESVAGLLQELQTDNPTTPIISVGDYNAYQFNDGYTDPIATLKGTPTADNEVVVDESPDLVNPNFINLSDGLPADQRYSFIFEGTPQLLDHVLLNTVAQSFLQRYAVARNNSDFPEVPGLLFSNDPTRPERCSDHDMPVAYFKFPCVIACPANVVQSNDLGQCGAIVNYPAPGTSASCSTVTCTPSSGSFFPVGSTTVTCSDSTGGSCSFAVTINDTEAATITGESANPAVLWPPNHRLVPVTINYTTSDNCGPVTCTLSVTSNEPINSTDDGDTAPDWIIDDAHHVKLRAERSGIGTGRIYTITITCTDGAGNSSIKTVVVTVPLTK